jgi:hypothetical protein
MCRACVGIVFESIGETRPRVSWQAFFAAAAGARPLANGLPDLAAVSDGADLIFRGGPIIPMAGDSRTVEALAIKNGKLAAAGAVDAIMSSGHCGSRRRMSPRSEELPGHKNERPFRAMAAYLTRGATWEPSRNHEVIRLVAS